MLCASIGLCSRMHVQKKTKEIATMSVLIRVKASLTTSQKYLRRDSFLSTE